jgi:hypothetical protein
VSLRLAGILLGFIAVLILLDALTLYIAITRGPIPAYVELGAPTAFRNLYVHVQIGIATYLLFTIAFIAAIGYLVSRRRVFERFAHAFIIAGFLYGIAAWITGSVWAGESWGGYWTWDPRQTGVLFMVLVYAVYFVLRRSVRDPDVAPRISMVYAVAAYVTIPLSFILPYIMPSLHPTVSETRAFVGAPVVIALFPIRMLLVITISALLALTLYLRLTGRHIPRYVILPPLILVLVSLIPLASIAIAMTKQTVNLVEGASVEFTGVVVDAKLLSETGGVYTFSLDVRSGGRTFNVRYTGEPPINPVKVTVRLPGVADEREVLSLLSNIVTIKGRVSGGLIEASSIDVITHWSVPFNALVYALTILTLAYITWRLKP